MEIEVALCSDTEDNPPNYFPGWSSKGSNLDKNPAAITWDWTRYWHTLSGYFHDLGIPITWLIRVDSGPVYDTMLRLFRTDILENKAKGDEIGIHIHTFCWDSVVSKWRQTRVPTCEARIVRRSIEYFKDVLGFYPLSVRMGWNTMSNAIMGALDREGVLIDASAIPGSNCRGKFDKRDNIHDWCGAPREPYHPNSQNYKSPGNMRILEVPITTLGTPGRARAKLGTLVDLLSKYEIIHMLAGFSPLARRIITPHSSFYFSPWWSASVIDEIVDMSLKTAKSRGKAVLVGYFHSSDIMDPKKNCENSFFMENFNRFIERVTKLKGINVRFSTLSGLSSCRSQFDVSKVQPHS